MRDIHELLLNIGHTFHVLSNLVLDNLIIFERSRKAPQVFYNMPKA